MHLYDFSLLFATSKYKNLKLILSKIHFYELQRDGLYKIGFPLSIMNKGFNLTMLTGNALN